MTVMGFRYCSARPPVTFAGRSNVSEPQTYSSSFQDGRQYGCQQPEPSAILTVDLVDVNITPRSTICLQPETDTM